MTRRYTTAQLAQRKAQRQKAEREMALSLLPFGVWILVFVLLDALPRLLGR